MTRALARIGSQLRWDLVVQMRQGFLAAGGAVAASWIILALQWRDDRLLSLVPVFVLGNLTITSFYFAAGLLQFEKEEGTLRASWLTPLRSWEYLTSKVASLALFAMTETSAILAAGFGLSLPWAILLLGMAATSSIYTLIAIRMIVRFDGIGEFIFPSVPVLMVLGLPMLSSLGVWDSPLLWLIPTHAPLKMMEWGMAPERVGIQTFAIGLVLSVGWIILIGRFCQNSLQDFAAGTSQHHNPRSATS